MEGATQFETVGIYSVLVVAIAALIYAWLLRTNVLKASRGSERIQKVARPIREGAVTYLNQQFRTIIWIVGILAVLLFLSAYLAELAPAARELGFTRLQIALGRAGAFLAGSFFSIAVGRFGMLMAVEGSLRVAAASAEGKMAPLQIAYRAGTITGMLTDGLGLFGGTLIFIIFTKAAPEVLLGFGFGGTLLALFMRVGGGIYTKAADVGADLVGKVEAGLEEDDPRNAAVVADLVGDNVGDCAGMAADIFESYEVTIVSGLILGLALVRLTGNLAWIVFPLLVRGIGVLSSIISTYTVKGGKEGRSKDAMDAIFRSFLTSAAISVVLFGTLAFFYMQNVPGGWWRPALSVTVGVVLAIILDRLTDYFTGTEGAPVKEILKSTDGGPATTIMSGLSVGYESSVWAVFIIATTIFAAIAIYGEFGTTYVLYSVALAGIGMLTLTGNNVAMDSFGPISDNANGIGEMAGLEPKARQIMADLDAVGNTTKAITKGIAIGSAVIAAVSLFGSFITDVGVVDPQALVSGIRVSEPRVFVGMLIGGAIPWLFSSFAIKAVSRAA
ncbi:MAG: sodium/proton-translocating pyrophosphatase, partial [Chloroflexi bacterium]|nr:sodium/proton-translocating pyrophosphatase [Chloroflexota bacterium]